MYHLMFGVLDVAPFLLEATDEDRRGVVFWGGIYVNAVLLGGFLAFLVSPFGRPNPPYFNAITPLSKRRTSLLLVFAWIPLILAACAYFMYFRGQPYVELHIDGGGVPGYALKFVYISFAVVLLLGLSGAGLSQLKWKILWLTVAFIIIYGLLFKLRSPLLFYFLLLFFLYGRRLSLVSILILGISVAIGLSAVALIRDASLTEGGVAGGLIDMVMGLGDQANSIIFAENYLNKNGAMWGVGILGSLTGLAEPLVNEYSRSISQSYFEAGGGFGFFIVSDFMVNFGSIFGVIFMAAFGFWVASIRRDYSQFWLVALNSVIFSNAFSLVRNDFGSTFRASLYTLFALMVIVFVCKATQMWSLSTKIQKAREN